MLRVEFDISNPRRELPFVLTGKWLLAALAFIPVLADLLSTMAAPSGFWAEFLQSFYYVAIVIAGLSFGWEEALGLAFFAGVCHALIFYFLPTGSFLELGAQLLAFLLVGFAFVLEREQAAGPLPREVGVKADGIERGNDSQTCVKQVAEIASELLREIRTPLASIEGAAFILKDDSPQPTDAWEFVEIIQKECSRVSRALAEIGACTEVLPLNREASDLGAMLAEAARLSALEVPAPGIALRTEVAPSLPLVWCDRKQILQVIVPFVTSTMKAMPGGGEILLAADRLNAQARIRLVVLGETISAGDPAAGRGPYSSTYDEGAGKRILAARRTMLQHGGTLQVEQIGQLKRLQSLTIPLSDGQFA
jgi:signal transduction histidine kinase